MSPKCNLIIDSCCDLPFDIVDRSGVALVNFTYHDADGDHTDDLWQSEDMRTFYDKMRKGSTPTTSCVSPTLMREAFERAAKSGIPTVYLCFSSGLSSHHEGVCATLEDVLAAHGPADVRIVDTHLASTGEALLVFEALRKREEGFTADEMVEWATEAQYMVQTYFMVDNLDALNHGGRIPKGIAFAGTKLNVKPILAFNLDGGLAIAGAARGRNKALRILAEKFRDDVDAQLPSTVCMGHADCEKDMLRLKSLLHEDGRPLQIVPHLIGPVIGSHVGPGMVSISFWGHDRRK